MKPIHHLRVWYYIFQPFEVCFIFTVFIIVKKMDIVARAFQVSSSGIRPFFIWLIVGRGKKRSFTEYENTMTGRRRFLMHDLQCRGILRIHGSAVCAHLLVICFVRAIHASDSSFSQCIRPRFYACCCKIYIRAQPRASVRIDSY